MWLTLLRRGTVRMAQPPTVFFGPDGGHERQPKIFVRGLLYATSTRGHIVESMFARVRRGDSSQAFPVWVCGEARNGLSRGAGLAVRADGHVDRRQCRVLLGGIVLVEVAARCREARRQPADLISSLSPLSPRSKHGRLEIGARVRMKVTRPRTACRRPAERRGWDRCGGSPCRFAPPHRNRTAVAGRSLTRDPRWTR